jgi:hypothetical protein
MCIVWDLDMCFFFQYWRSVVPTLFIKLCIFSPLIYKTISIVSQVSCVLECASELFLSGSKRTLAHLFFLALCHVISMAVALSFNLVSAKQLYLPSLFLINCYYNLSVSRLAPWHHCKGYGAEWCSGGWLYFGPLHWNGLFPSPSPKVTWIWYPALLENLFLLLVPGIWSIEVVIPSNFSAFVLGHEARLFPTSPSFARNGFPWRKVQICCNYWP